MSVESPQIKIDPYQSTIPLVPPTEIPQQDLQSQQAPRIYSRTAGIAQFADTAMKGLLKGLQLKEERKFETAEAVMNAQDAAIGDAKKRYQDALITKGKDDPETQATWGAYTEAVNKAAEARQAFAVPEKTAKQPKGSKKDKTAADGAPAAGGFGANLKQFFERNPHIVPELAIIGMKSQVDPKLYGQMTPELTAQKQQYDDAQREEANKTVYDAARATYNQLKGRPNLTDKQKSDLANAEAVLTPITANAKFQILVDPQGQEHNVPVGTEIPEGWKAYEKPTALTTPRVGSAEEITANYLRQHNIKPEEATPELLKYLRDYAAYKSPQTSSTTSGSTVDVAGNRTTTSSTTRGAGEPKPPAGFAAVGEDSPKATGTMTRPPGQGAAPTGGKGRMTAPPSADGKPTLTQANRTMRVETQEKQAYDKATAAYEKQLNTNRAKAPDKASLDAANAKALADYNAAKAQIVLWKAAQVKAIGGDPWKKGPDGTQFYTDGKGNQYGTMDGVNWVNVTTGLPYQEQ